jgi:hypothetical protein
MPQHLGDRFTFNHSPGMPGLFLFAANRQQYSANGWSCFELKCMRARRIPRQRNGQFSGRF